MTWIWRRKWRFAALTMLVSFVLLNVLARRHVHALTHFAPPDAVYTGHLDDFTLGDKIRVICNGVVLPKPRNTRTPANVGLEYETVHYGGYAGKELESWFVPGKGDSTVLLFHGYCASKEAMIDAAREFHDWGWSSLLVDFHGSGGSTGDSTGIGYSEAEDVASSFAWARQHLPEQQRDRLLLYGRSMGGAAVARACADLGVEPDAIVLESVFPTFRETVAQRFKLMGLPAFPAADLLLFWGEFEMKADPWKHNPADYATRIHCPALILAGTLDNRIPMESVQAMRARFAGPAELHFYEAGHRAFLGTHPELWEQHLSGFLKTF